MTDWTRYDRTEKEAPLVPHVGTTSERKSTPTDATTGTTNGAVKDASTVSALRRQVTELRTQLDRVESTLDRLDGERR